MAIGKKTDAASISKSNWDVGMDDRSHPIDECGAAMAAKRPLSPHLGIYRFPITAILSISHRISGAVLVAGMLVLVICFMAGAAGPEAYDQVHAFLNSALGRLFLWGWLYALFFHLCHGVRHLVWDMGKGFNREHQDIAAYMEITASILFTLAVFLLTHFSVELL